MADTSTTLYSRDGLLDTLRGFALIIIVIDHIVPSILAQFTPQMLGFSDMAELFVLVSGISFGMTYSRRLAKDGFWSTQRKALVRTLQLYAAYVLTMTMLIPLTWLYAEEIPSFDALITPSSKVLNVWKVVFMTHSWGALPILKLYMTFVAVAPALVFFCHDHRRIVLICSGAVYAVVQIYTLLTGHTWSFDPLFVNPLAWQFLFVIGLASGAFRTEWKWPASQDMRAVLAAAAFIQVAFVVKVFQPWKFPGTYSVELGPLRVLHICSLILVVSWAASQSWGARSLHYWPSQSLQLLGRNALFAFCVGEILVAAANCFLKHGEYSTAAQISTSLTAVATMWGMTWMFAQWHACRRRSQSRGNKEIGLTRSNFPELDGESTPHS